MKPGSPHRQNLPPPHTYRFRPRTTDDARRHSPRRGVGFSCRDPVCSCPSPPPFLPLSLPVNCLLRSLTGTQDIYQQLLSSESQTHTGAGGRRGLLGAPSAAADSGRRIWAGNRNGFVPGDGDWAGSGGMAHGQAWAALTVEESMVLGDDVFLGNDQFVHEALVNLLWVLAFMKLLPRARRSTCLLWSPQPSRANCTPIHQRR